MFTSFGKQLALVSVSEPSPSIHPKAVSRQGRLFGKHLPRRSLGLNQQSKKGPQSFSGSGSSQILCFRPAQLRAPSQSQGRHDSMHSLHDFSPLRQASAFLGQSQHTSRSSRFKKESHRFSGQSDILSSRNCQHP